MLFQRCVPVVKIPAQWIYQSMNVAFQTALDQSTCAKYLLAY